MQENINTTSLLATHNIEELIDSNPAINDFKRKAKILHKNLKQDYKSKKKTDFISLRQCQDLVAQQHGYKHWHEFHTNIKNIYIEKKDSYFFKYEINSKKPNFKSGNSPINIGYNNTLGLQAWIDQNKMLDHMFIQGSDACRNEIEMHIIKQLINEGQNIIYMDGNGENEQTKKIIEYAKKAGREKDIRTLSFMTNYKKTENSNWYFPTNLPFTSGAMTEIIYSMLDNNTNDFWKGIAISLLSSVLMALVYMRDKKELILTFAVIRKFLELENILILSKRQDFPNHIQKALKTYLHTTIMYKEESIVQKDSVLEQHGYLQMQFVRILNMFADVYSHLFQGGLKIDEASERLLELSNNKKFIFIVKYPKFNKCPGELSVLSYFFLNALTYNTATKLVENSEIPYNKNVLNKKVNQNVLIINNCPLPENFAIRPAQYRYLNTALILSYEFASYELITQSPEAFNTIYKNMNIKLTINEMTKHNKISYNLLVEDMKETLIL